MKKVLFIYYMFPPMVGGWRAIGSFVKYLPELGWQATVVSAADTVSYPKDYSSLRNVPSEVTVHRVGHSERPRLLHSLLNKLRINIDFPDSFKGWYASALQAGRNILRHDKFDLIFSYGPPYTCHFVAMQLKKEFRLPWVVCFADLWSGNTYLVNEKTLIQPLRSWQVRRIQRGERRLLEEADRVVVRGWNQQQRLVALHGIKEGVVEVINHGYDEADFADLKPYTLYPDKLTITYIGSFYAEYQEPFQVFMNAVSEIAPDSEVLLVGQGTNLVRATHENLTRISYLPQRKAMALGMGSDFLLAIMLPSATWVVMKLYDYLRLGKPILALVPEDGDLARIVREARAGFIIPYGQEAMRHKLRMIFDEWSRDGLKSFQPDRDYIAQLERSILTKRLVQAFDEVAA